MAFDPKSYLIKLSGKDYLQVAHRILWFRHDHPTGNISTELLNYDPLVIRATVSGADGQLLGSGHGTANSDGRKPVWAGREVEKAETAAIGRALAHAGYGTQFTGEDEDDNIADSPVERKPTNGKRDAVKAEAEKLGGVETPTLVDVDRGKGWHTDTDLIGALKAQFGHSGPEVLNRLKKMEEDGEVERNAARADVVDAYMEHMAAKEEAPKAAK